MSVSQLIGGLLESGYRSGTLHLEFLQEAMERGLVDEKGIAEIGEILVDEDGDKPGEVLRMLAQYPVKRIFVTHPGTKSSSDMRPLSDIQSEAAKKLVELAQKYPETADAYLINYRGTIASSEGSFGDNLVSKLGASMLVDLLDDEKKWQAVAERHFWNHVMLGALEAAGFEGIEFYFNVHRFFEETGAFPNPDKLVMQDALKALSLQVPLLGGAIMAHLQEIGVSTYVRYLGERVVLILDGAMGVEMAAPHYPFLGRPAGIRDRRPPDERIVSLSAGIDLVGERIWQRLMDSLFFIPHPQRFLPSNIFWGMDFPAHLTDIAMIGRIAAAELSGHATNLHGQDVQKLLKGTFDPVRSAYVGIRNQGQGIERVFHVKVKGSLPADCYKIVVSSGLVRRGAFSPDIEMYLGVQRGKLASARYKIIGDKPLDIAVDKMRIDGLVSRARKGFVPSVPSGGELAGYGRGGTPFDSGAHLASGAIAGILPYGPAVLPWSPVYAAGMGMFGCLN